jgi:hypothetical protein
LMNTVAIQLEHAVFQGNVYLQRKLSVLLAMVCTTAMEVSAQLSIAMAVQQISTVMAASTSRTCSYSLVRGEYAHN